MGIFDKDEEYVELSAEEEKKIERIPIQVEKIEVYADSDRIQKKLRDGIVMLVDIKGIRQKDLNELKRAVARIRRTCEAINGDIVGIGEDWLIITPPFAKVAREI